MTDTDMTAYCVRCKTARPLAHAQPVYLANGRAATRGVCAECGTNLVRMGASAEHAGLPRPEPPANETAAAPAKAGAKAKAVKAGKRGGKKKSGSDAKAASSEPAQTPTGKRAARKAKPARGVAKSARREFHPGDKLVIVESPAKARTVGRFLGTGYDVRASIGHVRDLLRSQLSVDVENGFAPKYRVPDDKKDVVKGLRAAAAEAGEIYLATDPDREGEAIAWHLLEAANIPQERTQRVVFHEITRHAIAEAFAHSRSIDMQLVDAQQARRILDRLVGYQVSPLLWQRVRGRLSAGRVQSVALRLIVEREREIAAFVPVEYWSLDADLAQQKTRPQQPRPSFLARLIRIRGEEADLRSWDDADAVLTDLQDAAYDVGGVKRGERRRRPNPPFTTSTLQQDAAAKLGMTSARTMRVAQDLYEGIDVGEGGTVGLITYMRTDSVNVSREAQDEARELITELFGPDYLPGEPNVFRSRAKNAQEAHEAIRPTSSRRTPAMLRDRLAPDQFRLYELIWRRFMASQMTPAVYDTVSVDVTAGHPLQTVRPYLFRASGSTIRFPGFLAVYAGGAAGPAENGGDPDPSRAGDRERSPNGRDGDAEGSDSNGSAAQQQPSIPGDLFEGEPLDLLRLLPEQHFTQPPPRFSEASLVRALEEHGIGRPSTYAAIISTILERAYVERADKKLAPTELGFTVNDLLVKHFDSVFNVGFTASMEEHLDGISRGEEAMVPVLQDFYAFFSPLLQQAERTMERVSVEPERIGEACPDCGGELVIKLGRFGKFVGCGNYPTCRFTRPLTAKIGVRCPRDGGEMVERRTRSGRTFFGCANYPACDFTSWKRPLPHACPHCGGMLVVAGKDAAECTVCGKRTKGIQP